MKISFRFPSLDSMLSGGLESDTVTLIYGEAGSGKTNLCLVLAHSVALSGKRVAYIDPEGISPGRVSQVFADAPGAVRRILFFRPLTLWEQGHAISQAAKLKEVGLVILDTFNMLIRLGSGDEKVDVGKALMSHLDRLHKIARERGIPVVIAGQVFTGSGDADPRIYFGDSAMHLAKTILRLEKTGPNMRRAVLVKHRSLPEGLSAEFRTCDSGICLPGDT